MSGDHERRPWSVHVHDTAVVACRLNRQLAATSARSGDTLFPVDLGRETRDKDSAGTSRISPLLRSATESPVHKGCVMENHRPPRLVVVILTLTSLVIASCGTEPFDTESLDTVSEPEF